MPQAVKIGRKERMDYSTIREVADMPNLIKIQTESYRWFANEGLREVFSDISPIEDFAGNLALHFTEHKYNTLEEPPKFSQEECKERDATYSAPLKVGVRLINKETGEIKEQEVFMGEFPLMTEKGTFICNGAERVVVTQLVRSPGPYYNIMDSKEKVEKEKTSERAVHKQEAAEKAAGADGIEELTHFKAQIIPNRGAWLEYETDDNGILYVRVDRTRKLPATVLIKALSGTENSAMTRNPAGVSSALGGGTEEDIIRVFGADPKLLSTLEKDTTKTYEDAIMEIFRKIRPGDMPTPENAKRVFENLFFDPKRYDLAKVGRYKYNKKLGLSVRLAGHTLAENVIDPSTGEVLAEAGQEVDKELAQRIENAGVFSATVKVEVVKKIYMGDDRNTPVEEVIERDARIIGNRFVNIDGFVDAATAAALAERGVPKRVHFPALMAVLKAAEEAKAAKKGKDAKSYIIEEIVQSKSALSPKHMLADDIIASVSYLIGLPYGIGSDDDIDHLGNRRVRTVGELLQNQFRIGLARMERAVRERMTIQDVESATPQQLMNIRPVTAAIKEFFGSSQLSQFMDQNNPLAELTHKRRLSALGPGGLSRERAGFEVRDVHYSHYGRMCPIETPEGPNIGLIGSLTTYGKVNEYGFIETPYRRVDKTNGIVTEEIEYLSADEEESLIIAQANEPLDSKGRFVNKRVAARKQKGDIDLVPKELVDYMDVSPKQVVSVATAMIPFLENDDANRALMGSNMQRQAVPLLVTESPIIGTGMEYLAARDSGVVALARNAGTVEYVDAESIRIRIDGAEKKSGKKAPGEEVDVYRLLKFKRSNQGTCINQRPIVLKGEHVEAGEVIADGPSTEEGEVALGKNLLIGFMTWEGYNYEDAIILNERLIMDDTLTSLHIEEYECEARDTKLGPEEITRDIPNVGDDARKDLDESGVVRIGAEVTSYDILVGKVTPKGETDLTAEERLLRAIFGEKAREVRDTSLKVPHGETGIVVDIKTFSRDAGDDLPPGVNKLVRVYVATKRKISVGDKMAGRHGNKGVISRILPEEDMPFLENGTPLQVMLNPLGVPSRMNVGQVLEVHLGLAAKEKGWYISTPVFDGAHEADITQLLKECGYPENGKLKLRDGRTGEAFDNPVTVGYMYMLKLHHLVDDKIHARSTGPYSLITQQPLGGKAQFGGQRFGEMEVWALEAYGAAYTLQEILTVKSDDIVGRVKTYEAIVKGDNIPEPSIPESFKVLIKEMQSLCLDVTVRDENDEEIALKEFADLGASTSLERIISSDALTPEDDGFLSVEPLPTIDDADEDIDLNIDFDDDSALSEDDVIGLSALADEALDLEALVSDVGTNDDEV
ncbi:MAG: DNA-directed RNA polymerase subunit beta [Clostridiales Family XIII bacterium]|jgi:DNA-directed RNA polymerase subunit beta|nr:DNA-directed RNA polymerase subunit beta [Clostridiales Family XIII bacterium]